MEERNIARIFELQEEMMKKLDQILKKVSEKQEQLIDVANRQPDPAKPEYEATCSMCHRTCKVPFKPRTDWPVFCRDCYGLRNRK